MADAIKAIKKRPGEMRLMDATQYRLPPAGWVSILHRISGLLILVLLPFIIWLFDKSLTSEVSFDEFRTAFIGPNGAITKIVCLVLLWAFLQHFLAGLRHLWMDATHDVSKEFGRQSAIGVLVASLALTVVLGAKLFGLSDRAKDPSQMAINYGSKRLVVGAHYGLRDWLVQRVTAVLMALFTIAVIVQVLIPADPDETAYEKWAGIFSHQWMKVLTFVTIVAIIWHAWVGVRDVLMDYVKPFAQRLVLQVAAIVWLVGCAGWALQVLWRL